MLYTKTDCHPHWQRANRLVAQFVNIFGPSTGYKPASQLVCCILKRLKIFSARSPENDAFVGAAPSKTANVAYYKVDWEKWTWKLENSTETSLRWLKWSFLLKCDRSSLAKEKNRKLSEANWVTIPLVKFQA